MASGFSFQLLEGPGGCPSLLLPAYLPIRLKLALSLVEPTTPSEATSLVLCSGTVLVSLPASRRDIGFLMLPMLPSLPQAAKEVLG